MAYREDPHRKPPTDKTVETFLIEWLETMQPPRTRPSTLRGYRQKLGYVIDGLGPRPLRSLTTQEIECLYGRLGAQLC